MAPQARNSLTGLNTTYQKRVSDFFFSLIDFDGSFSKKKNIVYDFVKKLSVNSQALLISLKKYVAKIFKMIFNLIHTSIKLKIPYLRID